MYVCFYLLFGKIILNSSIDNFPEIIKHLFIFSNNKLKVTIIKNLKGSRVEKMLKTFSLQRWAEWKRSLILTFGKLFH